MKTARLIDSIEYDNGVIAAQVEVEEETVVDNFEVVESDIKGWGSANAVVLVDGGHYLAEVC